MKKKIFISSLASFIVVLIAFVLISNSNKVSANPSTYVPHNICNTATYALGSTTLSPNMATNLTQPLGTSTASLSTATTSLLFMAPGTATTTMICDSYALDTGDRTPLAINKAVLAIGWAASSTNSTINIETEYSNDAVDWYKDTVDNFVATTTTGFYIQVPRKNIWSFASSSSLSSTIGGGNGRFGASALFKVGDPEAPALATATSTELQTRAIKVDMPTRYIRVLIYPPAGSANSSVYAELMPMRETK